MLYYWHTESQFLKLTVFVMQVITTIKTLHFQPKLWDGYGKNNESVSDLWIGLLNFYSHEFNFNDFVISIRQKEPLTKFERLWNGKCIAIEGEA